MSKPQDPNKNGTTEPDSTDRAPTIIDANEAAKLLGINRNTLYAGANTGEVPCRRVGRKFLFVREVLIEWLRH